MVFEQSLKNPCTITMPRDICAYRMDPLNNIGSWRMMESLERKVSRGSLEISIPSIIIDPGGMTECKTDA